MSVSAVIVTRGDVPVAESVVSIRESGVVDEILVWANDSAVGPNVGRVWARDVQPGDFSLSASTVDDLGVYGRYAAIEYTRGDLIYVQDDDCVIEPEAIRSLYASSSADELGGGGRIIANMPVSRWDDYPDSCLVGWGAVFHRDLPAAAFHRYGEWRNGYSASGAAYPPARLADPTAPEYDPAFRRTCDVVFTTLAPHRKIDLGFRHLPWAETAGRMFKQPNHKKERDEMLELARRIRDGD